MHLVQSVIFTKPTWTRAKAKEFLQDNDFKYTSIDEKVDEIHYPQLDRASFKRVRYYRLGDGGISFAIGTR